MRLGIPFFALGIWLCQQQANLLPWQPCLALGLVLLGCALLLRHRSAHLASCTLLLVALLGGLAWAGWRAELRLEDRLTEALEGEDVRVIGRVADLPQTTERGLRFLFDILEAPDGVPQRLSLNWYGQGEASPIVHAGERWQLTVRLRQPHGSLNPHGFDYEAWMFERGIGASGYVRPRTESVRLARFDATPMAYIDHWRETIRARFIRTLPDSPWRGVLVALVVGDQAAIPKAQWTLFRQTGVTHLMSISGLHVTLTGTLAALLVGFLWRRVPVLALRVPAQKAALVSGALTAGFYVLLAGSGVPAQRTFYMLAVAALGVCLGRGAGAARVLASALLVVLLIDPWAVLAAGFWLSFGAVAALLLMASGVTAGSTRWRWLLNWMRAQWAVTLLTLPLLLGLFQQFSLVSPLANALAIPLVSALITPLALGFAVIPLPALAELANWLLDGLMVFLQACATLPFALWQQAAPPGWLVALACLAAAWALLPRGVPGRRVVLLVFLPLLSWTPVRPLPGAAQVSVLDVGQGLAVHVRTAQHDLLFDTGPQYSSETDAGERIVLPFLRALGTRRLDRLIVSHGDIDHAGGADGVLAGIPVVAWRSTLPQSHPLLAHPVPYAACQPGETWEWDGVRFEILHPPPDLSGSDNERSCVLRVVSRGGRVLLTGDIGRRSEAALLATMPAQVEAEVLVAPHHGSRSSSSPEFVAAVGAQHVIFTAGYRNRFRHPSPEVVARYAASGANLYRSDRDGAVIFELDAEGIRVRRERVERQRYWHDRTS